MNAGKLPAMAVLLLSFFILPPSVQAKYSGGSGDPNDPYQISTAADLLALAADINDYSECFILTADINLASYSFATAVIAPNGIAFSGVFDGAVHKILNLTIDTNGVTGWYLGLFGRTGGEVKNLWLENVSITAGDDSKYLGGLVGRNYGSISNCYSTGAVTGGDYSYFLGGLVGYNESVISNCYSTGNVTSKGYSEFLGGLVGDNEGVISNCYSTGAVSGDGDIGGLVGLNGGSISSSYFLVTSGPDNGYGVPLTNTQMKQQSSFIGWDFVWETVNGPNDIWAICEGISYPKLAWQFVVGDSDNDRDVDFVDFARMALKWLQADSNLYCGGIDLTGDGLVDLNDLAIICDNWLEGL